MLSSFIPRIDGVLINNLRRLSFPFARFAIFIVFFWFGLLKVLSLSPASPLVLALLDRTMPFFDPSMFLIGFGIFEVIIGIVFLIPHLERLAIALLIPHLVSTVLPLFLLKSATWANMFVPTMEGQYIIKNVLIVAVAIAIAANLKPLKKS